jgi:hypothetical protein
MRLLIVRWLIFNSRPICALVSNLAAYTILDIGKIVGRAERGAISTNIESN